MSSLESLDLKTAVSESASPRSPSPVIAVGDGSSATVSIKDVPTAPAGDPAPPSAADAALQPLAVYLQWTLLGGAALGVLPRAGLDGALARLAQAFPGATALCSAGAIAVLLLLAIERGKRNRAWLGQLLLLAAALLIAASVGWQGPEPRVAELCWGVLLGLSGYGAFHLLLLEDWIAGRSGPGMRLLARGLRDVALGRWWFWSSKVARRLRAQEQRELGELRVRRAREEAELRSAEDALATLEAQRREADERSAASKAVIQAAHLERVSAEERSRADEALRAAQFAEALRLEAENRLASARRESAERGQRAESAALERARWQRQRLEAERQLLEAAIAAAETARQAIERNLEAKRASSLLQLAESELKSLSQAGV